MTTYGIICSFGFAALLAAVSVQCSKIIEQMTDDEVASLFHTTRDKIPEYDVVSVRHNRYRRSEQSVRLQFSAFGKEIDSYLHPSDGQLVGSNTPIWLASTQPNGTIEYKKMREGIVGLVVSSFLANSTDLSAIVVNHEKGENPSFNGIVDGLIIRPVPKRFQEQTTSRQNSEARNTSRPMIDTHDHVIIKSTLVTEEEKIRSLERQIREASRSSNRADAFRKKRSNQEVIFPSLLIQTDFKVSKNSQNDLDYAEEIIYQLAFWNAVDLRFRHVNDPKIRLRIVGIIMGLDRTATPHLQNHRPVDVVVMDGAWPDIVKYWSNMAQRKDFPQEAYDVVVTMTDSEMFRAGHWILGIAAKPLCHESWPGQFYATTIIRDGGGFDGVITACHEMGHIMGLRHDPDSSGDECDASNNFIMQANANAGPKNLEWSPCSLETLKHFLRRENIRCADKPGELQPIGDPVKRILPGDVWGPEKQCQGRGYSWSCETKPNVCTHMQCYHVNWQALFYGWWCQDTGPAAEGTPCAPGHKCVDGKCQCMTVHCIYLHDDTKS